MARKYISLHEFKLYQGIDDDHTQDDNLITESIEEATARIESHCGGGAGGRTFEAVAGTFYYESDAVEDNDLWLGDKDLLTITTLTNGDDSATVIPSTEYFLIPRNSTPYYVVRLMSGSSYQWQFDIDGWVSILGTWGYSTEPDEVIKKACKRLTAWYYHQKDAKEFGTTAFPEIGLVSTAVGLPVDVKRDLEPYVRIT